MVKYQFHVGDFVQFDLSNKEAAKYVKTNPHTCSDPFIIVRIEHGYGNPYAVWDSYPRPCPGAYLSHLMLAEGGPW